MNTISPCSMCIEANCDNCACAICKSGVGEYFCGDTTNMFEAALRNPKDGDKFINRLKTEMLADDFWDDNPINDCKKLKRNWRGFKKQGQDCANIFAWLCSHLSFNLKGC